MVLEKICWEPTKPAGFTAGDRVSVSVTPSGTPAAARVSFILEFVPTIAGQTVLMGGTSGATSFGTSTVYTSFVGASTPASTESNDQNCNAGKWYFKKPLLLLISNARYRQWPNIHCTQEWR